MEEIRLTDIDDFQRHYLSLYPQLKYFALKFVDSPEAVDDVLQNVWMRIWEGRLVFANELALKAYLYKGIRNEALNQLRTEQRERAKVEGLLECADTEEPDILCGIIESEVYAMVSEAFADLSDACRRVYVESLNGKPQRQIAEELGISVNTVKKHINRANHLMRERLEKLLALIALLR